MLPNKRHAAPHPRCACPPAPALTATLTRTHTHTHRVNLTVSRKSFNYSQRSSPSLLLRPPPFAHANEAFICPSIRPSLRLVSSVFEHFLPLHMTSAPAVYLRLSTVASSLSCSLLPPPQNFPFVLFSSFLPPPPNCQPIPHTHTSDCGPLTSPPPHTHTHI